ncbi:hypothetical protein AFE_1207 [Acidithiobacillus ferrooxidans ATCC 23270]|uniref:Uncharacterized protein n=1 Tax=Acidithiobacillus ferrooxidans (strain ATCC 23270 / DSM 14882 / CIP 104768 / NCIMB 8455) TaxID=243159 RepID=B7J8P0_ACIF2|nr:hypothetical protein AFE_1207 [Acidithiobacillus ferrooxidans ATCC 23270]
MIAYEFAQTVTNLDTLVAFFDRYAKIIYHT